MSNAATMVLPRDLLRCVLSFVDHADRKAVHLVCKRWRELATQLDQESLQQAHDFFLAKYRCCQLLPPAIGSSYTMPYTVSLGCLLNDQLSVLHSINTLTEACVIFQQTGKELRGFGNGHRFFDGLRHMSPHNWWCVDALRVVEQRAILILHSPQQFQIWDLSTGLQYTCPDELSFNVDLSQSPGLGFRSRLLENARLIGCVGEINALYKMDHELGRVTIQQHLAQSPLPEGAEFYCYGNLYETKIAGRVHILAVRTVFWPVAENWYAEEGSSEASSGDDATEKESYDLVIWSLEANALPVVIDLGRDRAWWKFESANIGCVGRNPCFVISRNQRLLAADLISGRVWQIHNFGEKLAQAPILYQMGGQLCALTVFRSEEPNKYLRELGDWIALGYRPDSPYRDLPQRTTIKVWQLKDKNPFCVRRGNFGFFCHHTSWLCGLLVVAEARRESDDRKPSIRLWSLNHILPFVATARSFDLSRVQPLFPQSDFGLLGENNIAILPASESIDGESLKEAPGRFPWQDG